MKSLVIIVLWLTILLSACSTPVEGPVATDPEQESSVQEILVPEREEPEIIAPEEPAETVPEKETLADVLEALRPSDISCVVQNLDRGTALHTQTLIRALNRVSEAADDSAELTDWVWYAEVLLEEERLYDRCITLKAGLQENLVEVALGKERITAWDEELYWMVRRNQNVQTLGIDWEAYDRYRPYVDACLETEWEVPPDMMEQIRLELVGFQRVHINDAIGAELYEIEIVANADSLEAARYFCAGGAFIDSRLRVHGLGKYKYLAVVDGEPVGYGDWSLFYGPEDEGRFEEKFPTKEPLIEYLAPLPEVLPEPDMGVQAVRILEQLRNFEIGLAYDQFSFSDVSQLGEEQLFLLFLLQADDEELEQQYDPALGRYCFSKEQIEQCLDDHFAGASFEIEKHQHYDSATNTISVEVASGFGGNRYMRLANWSIENGKMTMTVTFHEQPDCTDAPYMEKEYALQIGQGTWQYLSAEIMNNQ